MKWNRLILCILLALFSCKKRVSSENPVSVNETNAASNDSLFLTFYSFNDADQYVHEEIGQFPSDYKPEDRFNSVPKILESINNDSNKTEFLNLGADYAYFNDQGVLTSFKTQGNLKENCYPILLKEDLDYLLYLQPDADWDDFLSLAPSLDFIGAGEVCIDENGRILELNNNSFYGTQIPTLANFILFLRNNGFVFSNPNQGGLGGWGSSISEFFGVMNKSKAKTVPEPRVEITPKPIVSAPARMPSPVVNAQRSLGVEISPVLAKSKPKSSRQAISEVLESKKIYIPKTPVPGRSKVELGEIQKGSFTQGANPIGSGSFGDVYKVKIEGKGYAVKVLKKENAGDEYESLCIKEIEASDMSNANGGGIPFHGAVKLSNGEYALVYDLAEGSLEKLGRNRYGVGRQFNGGLFWSDAEGLARGVKYYHDQKLILRDWKNENILVGENGLKISDYGAIESVNSVKHYASGTGSPFFMSPWRRLKIDIRRLERRRLELAGTSSLTSRQKKELSDLNKELKKKESLLRKYDHGLSTEELMIRDDIYSYMVALFEQRTGRRLSSFDIKYLSGEKVEGNMALELNKTSLRNAGFSDAEIAFFQKGLNMNPSKGGFASMDEVLVELKALRNESSPFGPK